MKIRGQIQRSVEISRLQNLVSTLSPEKGKHPRFKILFDKACAKLKKLLKRHNRKETRRSLIRNQK
jgi:hypothetical protein